LTSQEELPVPETQTGNRATTRSVVQLAIWTLAWVASVALAPFGPRFLWDSDVISWVAIGVNLVFGAGWIVAHARYLRAVDDLQRKILLDALAIALGVGVVGGIAASIAASAGLIDFQADIAFLSVVMAVVYMVAIAIGTLRYR
jgi:hypothetical protein